jgi:hypothetical protein
VFVANEERPAAEREEDDGWIVGYRYSAERNNSEVRTSYRSGSLFLVACLEGSRFVDTSKGGFASEGTARVPWKVDKQGNAKFSGEFCLSRLDERRIVKTNL